MSPPARSIRRRDRDHVVVNVEVDAGSLRKIFSLLQRRVRQT